MRRLPRLRAGAAAARWAVAQHRSLQRTLPHGGTGAPVAPPPPLPRGAVRAVLIVLRVRGATCLERSLIVQAWLKARGDRRDVVIGVRRAETVLAHAWIDGLEDGSRYAELHRVPA
jgi:hypothetical protein